MSERSDLTRILANAGNREGAWRDVFPLVLDELRSIAKARMARERPGHTLQATALVNEAWIRLAGDRTEGFETRRHFFGAAARAMERILTDHARRARATVEAVAQEFR